MQQPRQLECFCCGERSQKSTSSSNMIEAARDVGFVATMDHGACPIYFCVPCWRKITTHLEPMLELFRSDSRIHWGSLMHAYARYKDVGKMSSDDRMWMMTREMIGLIYDPQNDKQKTGWVRLRMVEKFGADSVAEHEEWLKESHP